jgi:hypothetical protein
MPTATWHTAITGKIPIRSDIREHLGSDLVILVVVPIYVYTKTIYLNFIYPFV